MDKEIVRQVIRNAESYFESAREAIADSVFDSIQLSCKTLEDQLAIENFNKYILALPEKIRVQAEIYKEARNAFEKTKSDLVNAESMLMAVITAETNESGKPRFSNDTARRAELESRKKMDFDYSMALDPYKAALNEMENAQFKLDELHNEFKAYQTVGQVLAARLSLMKLDI